MSTRERSSGDTRTRIQQVALDLFAERGYEKTALREIAEELGVTKAALYYHFKTKEDIVRSIFTDSAEQIDELIEWAKTQPPGIETRREVVRRYAALMGSNHKLIRFMHENQPGLRDLSIGETMKNRMLGLFQVLSDDDAPLADQLRARLAVFSIGASFFALRDKELSDEELRQASLDVALDLIRR
ncbi:TetR/AcrR family transcriptional regulator [Actinocatenispora rupis]|uniref:TetR family transcriptional regulator n=1 Tax=Actinocatenispora rupis TaxID=519421 RepID=A0A8J3JHL5_9ACTN|nr:TetR/AcrR family transcriptional regulator [Actinocatenispora rupis]GID15093.1 TetR family transcriptional regulator [Actinocatenispora rupis]